MKFISGSLVRGIRPARERKGLLLTTLCWHMRKNCCTFWDINICALPTAALISSSTTGEETTAHYKKHTGFKTEFRYCVHCWFSC